MSDSGDVDDADGVVDGVDDAVVADFDAVERVHAGHFEAAVGAGFGAEFDDGFGEAHPVGSVDFF